jgi:hypothetical protein
VEGINRCDALRAEVSTVLYEAPLKILPHPLQHPQIALTCKNHNAFEYSLKITKFTLIIEQLLDRIKN